MEHNLQSNRKSGTLAIIVAGGSGLRLSGRKQFSDEERAVPKQYMLLDHRPILAHTLDSFLACDDVDRILVVIHRDDHNTYRELIEDNSKILAPVTGGATRQESVYCGLKAAWESGFRGNVLIHDAVRPFVEPQIISEIINRITEQNSAIPAHQATDTLKKVNTHLQVENSVPRETIYCAQTPQGFRLKELFEIHQQAHIRGNSEYTDDASMFEAAGYHVQIVDAPSSNFKITSIEDLDRARAIITKTPEEPISMHADIRTGNGYDVHVLVPGDGVILCGHKIPHDQRLDGHSDADVALHAITDALLGTISNGDIGSHFPPSDPQWKGASSDIFLKEALRLVKQKGGMINNIDVTLICEAPKIGPHREAMIQCLADLCDLPPERVSIKATTNEQLGFIGRNEGIAAIATTTISFGTRA